MEESPSNINESNGNFILSRFVKSISESNQHLGDVIDTMPPELNDHNLPSSPVSYFEATCTQVATVEESMQSMAVESTTQTKMESAESTVVIDLQGGDSQISKPITFLPGGGNVVVKGGTLRASETLPGDRHLVETNKVLLFYDVLENTAYKVFDKIPLYASDEFTKNYVCEILEDIGSVISIEAENDGERIVDGQGLRIRVACDGYSTATSIEKENELVSQVDDKKVTSISLKFSEPGVDMMTESHTSPHHEQQVERLALGLGSRHVSISSMLSPMVRVVPRGLTASVDASQTPVINDSGFRSVQNGVVVEVEELEVHETSCVDSNAGVRERSRSLLSFHETSREPLPEANDGINSAHSLSVKAVTCLQLMEITIRRIETSLQRPTPTLKVFVTSAFAWLKRLQSIALKEEVSTNIADGVSTSTLLGFKNYLSSLCSGAEFLLQLVHDAIRDVYLEFGAFVPAADLVVHVLDYLHKKLEEMCLVQGGEEEAYLMVLYMYVGSLLPYIKGLDSRLFDEILDDPPDEMFVFANKEVSVAEAEFSKKIWYKFLIDTLIQKGSTDLKPKYEDINNGNGDSTGDKVVKDELFLLRSCLQNPVVTVCRKTIGNNGDALKTLNLSRKFCFPSLNNEVLKKAIFGGESTSFADIEGTNYTFGFQNDKSKHTHSQDERKLLEMLFLFPTILPSVQDDLPVSELLPFQRNNTLPSRVLHWMQNVDTRTTPLPLVIMHYCITAYVQKQVQESIRNSTDGVVVSAHRKIFWFGLSRDKLPVMIIQFKQWDTGVILEP